MQGFEPCFVPRTHADNGMGIRVLNQTTRGIIGISTFSALKVVGNMATHKGYTASLRMNCKNNNKYINMMNFQSYKTSVIFVATTLTISVSYILFAQ